jgi:poly-gamma-glutamate synthesis protein (capsule biosynthesis protein)
MRRRRASGRRRKLAALNAILLVGVGAVIAWNVWASDSGGETADERPIQENAAKPEPAEAETPVGNGADAPDAPTGETPGESGADDGGAPPAEPEAEEPTPDAEAEPPESDGSGGVPAGEGEGGGRVTLAFVGDVLLGESVGAALARNGFDYPYAHVKERLQAADFAAANLETSVTARELEKPGAKTYEFRSDPDALPAFKEAGFDLVNLANNHTLDFGPIGLRDTMKHLDESELLRVGAGETADEAYAPVYVEKNGLRVAVFGFTRVVPDTSWKVGENTIGLAETYDYTRPVEEIEKASKEADLVVVLTHWGDERVQVPHPKEQVELGRRFIDAGADLIVGSHPHVLQGFERYGDGWIAYSLGNFIFTKSKDPLTYEAAVLEAECGAGGDCRLKLTPYWADTPQPQPMPPERTKALLERLDKLSVGASVDAEGNVAADE